MDYSYQLYSARNEKSLDDTLKTLKQLGYAQVEGWGGQFTQALGIGLLGSAATLLGAAASMALVMKQKKNGKK